VPIFIGRGALEEQVPNVPGLWRAEIAAPQAIHPPKP